MFLYHNSQDLNYRNPFGAVSPNTEITIQLKVTEPGNLCEANIILWSETEGVLKQNMKANLKGENEILFSACFFTPKTPQLIWYSFEVYNQNECHYYGNNESLLGGEGKTYDQPSPPSFQVTVYQPRKVPDWYKNAIVYQIFPDRYHRGSDWISRTADCLKTEKKGRKHFIRQEWNDEPRYMKNNLGEVTHWDFFGGTLKGIEEKLPFLKQFGISAIYLNPIFEASSNHRYDTANYKKIDPRLGDQEAFVSLCEKAKEYGISLILDGVFNHAGCDSVYYDQYGNYGEDGAYGNKESKYSSWFLFTDEEHKNCECWWGTKDLPNFNKENKEYQNYIYRDQASVIRYWMRLGAKGWRLDVADELTDDFIEGIKQAIVETDPEGILLGEVWEDASNKVSYGKMRKYLLGTELDSVMNYPFRTILTGFLCGDIDSKEASRRMFSLYENYPKENFYLNLNLVGSHDCGRILTVLGKGKGIETTEDKSYAALKLSDGERELAIRKLRLLVLMQMTHPGIPSIYYGDEIGMEGGTDPYNRAPYNWEQRDSSIMELYRSAIALRKEYPVFVDGSFEPCSMGEDVYGYRRTNKEDDILVLINRCPYHEVYVQVKTKGKNAFDLWSAKQNITSKEGYVTIELPILGAAVLRFEEDVSNSDASKTEMKKGAGVLCHVSSIASSIEATGTLGEQTKQFIRKLKEAKQSYWQILPLNPTDKVGSPYSSPSTFAGNIMLIDLEDLVRRGLLENEDLSQINKEKKMECLRKAFDTFEPQEDYQYFLNENVEWLKDDSRYHVLKKRFHDAPWQEWPVEYRDRQQVIEQDTELLREASFYSFCQYIFYKQWNEIKNYANECGIAIIGDLPFYMREDSSDVWAHRELFHLDENGYFTESAGVPPDYFSEDGQIWNVPTYDWNQIKSQQYSWWILRIKQAFERYDYVRLDHFRGFEQYFSIPKGTKALEGYWSFGPGRGLFQEMRKQLGKLPIFAEDLGQITPTVNDLTHLCGFMGMDVFQFSYGERYDRDGYHAKENAILYSGTHDNETLLGWCKNQDVKLEDENIICDLYQSQAPVVILQMQDVLRLENDARMNVPGTTEKNWKWTLNLEDFDGEKISWLKKLVEMSARVTTQTDMEKEDIHEKERV